MKKTRLSIGSAAVLSIFVFFGFSAVTAGAGQNSGDSQSAGKPFSLDFSTYLGGNAYEHARDMCVDNQGNIYVVGGTNSSNFPTTPNAYDRTFDNTGTQIGSAGYMDAFITKFNANGQLIWSTYLGGPNYDRAYGVEVDSQGYVYVAGRAGPGFPTTASAFQSTFKGVDAGIYGMQNAFAAKLSPDGSRLVWASYVGVGTLCRDLTIDDNGDVYVPLGYDGTGGVPPSGWFANAFQKTLKGGKECGVAKIRSDGTQVIWATWLGGSGNESVEASLRVDGKKSAYIVFQTDSTDIYTSPQAFDRTYNGGKDFYVAKVSPDGSSLDFATYLGGSGDEFINTHNLALDSNGNVYVSPWTNSSDFPTTSNAFQKQIGGGTGDVGLAKLSPTGGLLASTFIGGNGNDNADGIYVQSSGNVFLTGETESTNFPVTGDAYQTSKSGGIDAFLLLLSSDLSRLVYSTYMGGASDDSGRSGCLDKDGNLYVAGSTSGGGWPTKNAYQSGFQGGQLDVIIAKFRNVLIRPETLFRHAIGDFDNDRVDEAVMDFGSDGIWMWDSGAWTELSSANPDSMIVADLLADGYKEIIADLGPLGLWKWEHGSWTNLANVDPEGMAAGDVDGDGRDEVLADFGSLGLWLYDSGTWSVLSSSNPDFIVAGDVDGDLSAEAVVDFGAIGLWLWNNGSWSLLSPLDPDFTIATDLDADSRAEVIADFGPIGLWVWKSGTWIELSSADADYVVAVSILGHSTKELVADFGSLGLWCWDGGKWNILSNWNAEFMACLNIDGVRGDEVFADFGSLGLWRWDGLSWSELSPVNPDFLTGGDLDGDGIKELLVDFGIIGLWLDDGGVWSQLSGVDAE